MNCRVNYRLHALRARYLGIFISLAGATLISNVALGKACMVGPEEDAFGQPSSKKNSGCLEGAPKPICGQTGERTLRDIINAPQSNEDIVVKNRYNLDKARKRINELTGRISELGNELERLRQSQRVLLESTKRAGANARPGVQNYWTTDQIDVQISKLGNSLDRWIANLLSNLSATQSRLIHLRDQISQLKDRQSPVPTPYTSGKKTGPNTLPSDNSADLDGLIKEFNVLLQEYNDQNYLLSQLLEYSNGLYFKHQLADAHRRIQDAIDSKKRSQEDARVAGATVDNVNYAIFLCQAYGKGAGSGENPLLVGIKQACDALAGAFAEAYSGGDPLNDAADALVTLPATIKKFCNSACASSMYVSAADCYKSVASELLIPWDLMCALDSRNATRQTAFGDEVLCNDNALASTLDALDLVGTAVLATAKMRRLMRFVDEAVDGGTLLNSRQLSSGAVKAPSAKAGSTPVTTVPKSNEIISPASARQGAMPNSAGPRGGGSSAPSL